MRKSDLNKPHPQPPLPKGEKGQEGKYAAHILEFAGRDVRDCQERR